MNEIISPASGDALEILLYGHYYAVDLGLNAWQFAVELTELRQVGCSHNDIRWLVAKRFVEFAAETTSSAGAERTFCPRMDPLADDRVCFVLTEAGIDAAKQLAAPASFAGKPMPAEKEKAEEEHSILALPPRWDRDRQELRLGHLVIKRFKVPAINQERVLAAFEEEGWPLHIDDPLPPCENRDPKRRLHDTINALNRNQRCPLLRFGGDGRGEGVCWERVTMPPTGNGYQSR